MNIFFAINILNPSLKTKATSEIVANLEKSENLDFDN